MRRNVTLQDVVRAEEGHLASLGQAKEIMSREKESEMKVKKLAETAAEAMALKGEVLDIMASLQETAILRRSSGVGSCLSLEDVMQRVAGRKVKVKPDLPNL